MNRPTIYIDESGTLPDILDEVIIVAAVGTYLPGNLLKLIKTTQKQTSLKKLQTELKFYTAGDKTKIKFFESLKKQDLAIFILVIDKKGRKIPDTPEHFALLCWLLLTEVLKFYPKVKAVIFDQHFHKRQDLVSFNQKLEQLLGYQISIEHVSSREVKAVNVADMIAGATLSKIRSKNNTFYEIFSEKIISEIKINWPEAKKILVEKKNSLEPV